MQVIASGKALPRQGFAATQTLRIMKITAILLTVVCLHAAASGLTQTITLSAKNAPLEKIFSEILTHIAATRKKIEGFQGFYFL